MSKTVLFFKRFVSLCSFQGPLLFAHFFECFCVQECNCFGNVFDLLVFFPSMAGHKSIDAGSTGHFDVGVGLRHIDSMKLLIKPIFQNGGFSSFGSWNFFPMRTQCKVVCLLKEVHLLAIKGCGVDGAVMSSCFSAQDIEGWHQCESPMACQILDVLAMLFQSEARVFGQWA